MEDKLRKVYKKKIIFFNNELRRISETLNDLLNGTGILLTIAGLLSLLPSLGVTNPEYLPHFLIWTFPFILLSIMIYFPASLRVTFVIKSARFSSGESDIEIEDLKHEAELLQSVWEKVIKNHDSVFYLNRLTKALIYSYFFSVVSNFYVFTFFGKPESKSSIIIIFLTILIAIVLFVYPLFRSEKNKLIGYFSKDIAVGGEIQKYK